ncbi:MAG: hypothetical protein E4H01_01170 [Lysobacterales bacterium]|nr:MAG: hypothetical protein E4H01_01170 [Xanthomonadales bacterium]
MAEEQSQAVEQPVATPEAAVQSPIELALEYSRSQLAEEDRPRDSTGKFVPKEVPATEEAKPEEAAAEGEEQPAAEATEEEPAQPETTKYKIKVKTDEGTDEEIEVDEEELKRGDMKSKDYSVKTAPLAREREAVQTKVREAIEPKLKEYETQLETYKQSVLRLADPEAMSADLNAIALEDPARAQQLFFKRIEIQNTLQAITAEQEKVAAQRSTESQSALQKQAREAVEILKTDIPGWGDELYGKILKTGVDVYGFRPDEVSAITDHRAIKALHDAYRFQAAKTAKPSVDKRTAPVAPKVLKPGAGEKPDAGAMKWNEGMTRLRETGKSQDALALAKMYLANEGKQ